MDEKLMDRVGFVLESWRGETMALRREVMEGTTRV